MLNNNAWVYGLHAVKARLDRAPETVLNFFVEPKRIDDKRVQSLLDMAKRLGIITQHRALETVTALPEGAKHQGVLLQCQAIANDMPQSLSEWLALPLPNNALLLVLDGVQDPHNLGACLRSAEAAGVQGVILPEQRAVGITPVVRKVACGAAETVPVFFEKNVARALQALQEHGVFIVGLASEATQMLYDVSLTGPVALVLGAEGGGLRRLTSENCDRLARIPLLGTVESLNVSVAAGIALFEALRQRACAEKS